MSLPTDPASSWLLRNLVVPLWARHERSPYLAIAAKAAARERLPIEERRDLQFRQLTRLVHHAWIHNAFYRDRFREVGFEPGDLKSWKDLGLLPVLTKTQVREAGTRIISDTFPERDLRKKRTSGSTGVSLSLFADEACMQTRRGLTLYRDRWTGWDVAQVRAMVWGNPPDIHTVRQRLRRALLERDFYLDTLHFTEETGMEFCDSILNRRPSLLFGHAHSLYLLASFWKKHDLRPYRFKGIISTAMVLHPHERRGIEEMFGPVFDRYGCEEVSLIASECEAHHGLHVNTDGVVVEILESSNGTEKGLPGRVIVTDLLNIGMPFIRYEVGDRASLIDGECSCGRTYPLMGAVAGRVADFLITPTGVRISGISLTENFATLIPGIEQIQVIQDRRDHLELRLVPAGDFGTESRAEIARMIEELFGGDMRHTIVKVPRILPEPSGKYRFSICRIQPDGGATPGD